MIICSNFIIFFEKRLWQVGYITSGPILVSKIVKLIGIIPKFYFFQKKNNWKFAAVKKKQVLKRLIREYGTLICDSVSCQSTLKSNMNQCKYSQKRPKCQKVWIILQKVIESNFYQIFSLKASLPLFSPIKSSSNISKSDIFLSRLIGP